MRMLFAGATGVLGRATIPRLPTHEVVGLTRSPARAGLLRELGAEPVVCDVYDLEALLAAAERIGPDTVVNFVTDLSSGSTASNDRSRREGGDNLLAAATSAGAARLVVESVAFPLEGEAGQAVEHLERSARAFAGESLILRFGRLWGPDTFHQARPAPPAIHIDEAGAEAARLIAAAEHGTHVVA